MKEKKPLTLHEKIKNKIQEKRAAFIKEEENLDSNYNRKIESRSFISDIDDEIYRNKIKTCFSALCAIILCAIFLNIMFTQRPETGLILTFAVILAAPWICDILLCHEDQSRLLTIEEDSIIYHINHTDEIQIRYDEIVEIQQYLDSRDDIMQYNIVAQNGKAAIIIYYPSKVTSQNIRQAALSKKIRMITKKERSVSHEQYN